MSVISSKRRVILQKLHSMTDDAGVIRLCEDLCSDAERTESVAEERQRQITVISAENSANVQKCMEFTIQIERYRKTDIEQRREIESLKSVNGDYRNEIKEWADRCAKLQEKCDTLTQDLASLKEICEEEGRQKVILVDSFKELQGKYSEALGELKDLEFKLLKTQQILDVKNRYMFDTDSEKTSSLFGWNGVTGDPLDESMAFEDGEGGQDGQESGSAELAGKQYSADAALQDIQNRMDELENHDGQEGTGGGGQLGAGKGDGEDTGKRGDKGKTKNKGRSAKDTAKRNEMLAKLPNTFFFDYDYAVLDELYGEAGYDIIGFDWRWELRETRPVNYVYNYYRPIIKILKGQEKDNVYMEGFEKNFYPRSFASPSLVARIIYKRFCLALPLYRQEQEYLSRGVPLIRQTMCNWLLHFCGWDRRENEDGQDVINENALFVRAFRRLREELDSTCIIRQCDETTWKVILWSEESGKGNASNGYLWEHTSGEFSSGHKVTIYVFEESRSADHLREYLKDLTLYLVSDAYGAYFAVEKESGGKIAVASCWMHMRRKMSEAYIATREETKNLEIEEFKAHPAVKGLLLANEVFKAERPLRELSTEERFERRETEVAPHVDAFFDYVHELDKGGTKGKIREAVTYAINQEENLRVFHEDGDIPIDNGKAERGFKGVAIGRRNALFSYSIKGARSNAMLYSVIASAKANEADVYTYLKYLLEEINPRLDDNDPNLDDDTMPWSLKYKEYECRMKGNHMDEMMPESNLPPAGLAFKIKSLEGVSPYG